MNRIKYSFLSLSVVTFLISGCGAPSDKSDIGDISQTVDFPKDAKTAEPTVNNGEEVRDIVAQNQENSLVSASNDTENNNFLIALKNINSSLKNINKNTMTTRSTLDSGSQDCAGGGNINYSTSGSLERLTYTVQYKNCSMYGIYYNGSIISHASSYDQSTNNFKTTDIEFPSDFEMQISNKKTKIFKGSKMKSEVLLSDEYGNPKKIKLDIDMITLFDNKKGGQQGSSYIIEDIDTYTASLYQTKGKIYINNLNSYVEYDRSYDMSKTPFVFSNNILESGEGHYTMDGGKLKLSVENNQAKVYIDADNDGYYELTE